MGWTYLRRAMDAIPASCADQANEWGHIVETGPTSAALVNNVAFVWRRLEWRAIINQVRASSHITPACTFQCRHLAASATSPPREPHRKRSLLRGPRSTSCTSRVETSGPWYQVRSAPRRLIGHRLYFSCLGLPMRMLALEG